MVSEHGTIIFLTLGWQVFEVVGCTCCNQQHKTAIPIILEVICTMLELGIITKITIIRRDGTF